MRTLEDEAHARYSTNHGENATKVHTMGWVEACGVTGSKAKWKRVYLVATGRALRVFKSPDDIEGGTAVLSAAGTLEAFVDDSFTDGILSKRAKRAILVESVGEISYHVASRNLDLPGALKGGPSVCPTGAGSSLSSLSPEAAHKMLLPLVEIRCVEEGERGSSNASARALFLRTDDPPNTHAMYASLWKTWVLHPTTLLRAEISIPPSIAGLITPEDDDPSALRAFHNATTL